MAMSNLCVAVVFLCILGRLEGMWSIQYLTLLFMLLPGHGVLIFDVRSIDQWPISFVHSNVSGHP